MAQSFIYKTSRYLAYFGCLVLIFLAILSVISITGRTLSGFGLKPILGDFEIVEIGTALAVFCFMPLAHLTKNHATVDLFWRFYPKFLRKILNIFSDFLMLILWTLLVWRMFSGLLDYRESKEVSFILQIPVWWGYLIAFIPAIFSCLVYIWRFLEDLSLVNLPKNIALSLND